MKLAVPCAVPPCYNGQPYNALNDLTIDQKGRIYFTDPRYLGRETMGQPVQAVYRLDPDGAVVRLITDAGKPNGIEVSPDQKTLYVLSHDNGAHDFLEKGETAEKGLMACLAYALSPDGTVSNRKILVNWAPNDGGDGMTVDVDGNLYIAVRSEAAPGVYVYSPEGKQLAYVSTGKELPTNVAFGYYGLCRRERESENRRLARYHFLFCLGLGGRAGKLAHRHRDRLLVPVAEDAKFRRSARRSCGDSPAQIARILHGLVVDRNDDVADFNAAFGCRTVGLKLSHQGTFRIPQPNRGGDRRREGLYLHPDPTACDVSFVLELLDYKFNAARSMCNHEECSGSAADGHSARASGGKIFTSSIELVPVV